MHGYSLYLMHGVCSGLLDELAHDGCHLGLCLVGRLLYFFVGDFHDLSFEAEVGDDGHAEDADAAVVGHNDFGDGGHAHGVGAHHAEHVVFGRRFKRGALGADVHAMLHADAHRGGNGIGLAYQLGGITRPMSEGERQLMQAYVERGYDLFLTRCSEGRGISKEDMDGIAQGRVWSGSMAKELGLVDELGGLDKAIKIAAAKAGVDAYTLMNYPGKLSFWSELMATDPGNYIRMKLLDGRMKDIYHQVNMLEQLDRQDYLQARMPFELHIR